MNTHCCILLNDRAGAFRLHADVEQMRNMAHDLGLDAEVIGTRSAEQMRAEIRCRVEAGVQKIAVAGGDGTVACAVQHLAYTNTALGIIAQGTANNFATALRLPLDLPSALQVLQDGEIRNVDLGKAFDRYFTESAGVGLFADLMAYYGAGTNKNPLRALYAVMRVCCTLRARRIQLTIDGTPHTERAIMCTVANAYRMGEAVPVAPGAKVTDGELDVVIVGDIARRDLIAYYRAFRAQMQRSLPKVTTLRATEVLIESARPMNVHADDRIVGATPATIRAQPGALKVVVDRL